MNLSGIRISAGFYDYNSIENRAVTVGSELPAELSQSVTDQAPSAEEHAAPAVSRKSGPDQGAISDMRRDQVLEQYQFFVGTNPDEAQPVRPDENFIL